VFNMSDNPIPQFFTPNVAGDCETVRKVLVDNLETLQSSQIVARNRQIKNATGSTLALDGIPGIPFERGEPNPELFYQGEDVVYDLFLTHDGRPVTPAEYDIKALVKTSARAYTVMWQGTLDNGVYPTDLNTPGYYELWIPSSATASLFAGSYHLDIQIQERVGEGRGRYDRKYVLLQTVFNIEYSNFSEHPEAGAANPGRLSRSQVEAVWPNAPDTHGSAAQLVDTTFYSTQ
jgi:hypothetical protein